MQQKPVTIATSPTHTAFKKRSMGLDALRGIAILAMIFSGHIAHLDSLSGWLFHAQVGPPDFKFHPEIPGITWVDLVFPFFLFAMGAAFPLALRKKLGQGEPLWIILLYILKRGASLVFFAIFLQHMKPWALQSTPDAIGWLSSLTAFITLFLIYTSFKETINRYKVMIRVMGFGIAFSLLAFAHFYFGLSFSVKRSDIIILVLANMAIFGSLLWLFTKDNLLARLGIMALLIAIRLSKDIPGSWQQVAWGFSPATWLYTLYFCQYLLIIIPGTILGDMVYKNLKGNGITFSQEQTTTQKVLFGSILFSIIVLNLVGLYMRWLNLNFLGTATLLLAAYWLIRTPKEHDKPLYLQLFQWGSYWLLLGLFFEAYEGGIHKDHATISYYFVSSGLAIFTYIILSMLDQKIGQHPVFSFVVMNGQNPMIAYVGAALCIIPIFSLLHITPFLHQLQEWHPWLGILKGAIITIVVGLLTVFFTRRKVFWKN
ncbi:DUF5009 domain-containing protein [Algivirga pacifica]|uniref:DUF5009 domain-containing protein n=1 Tax=Algivirga pacifica TaxID=1162670 RepID=A0ABP9D7I4_9BACT